MSSELVYGCHWTSPEWFTWQRLREFWDHGEWVRRCLRKGFGSENVQGEECGGGRGEVMEKAGRAGNNCVTSTAIG